MSDGSNDLSFSGYKTAVIRHPQANKLSSEHPVFRDLASSFLYSTVKYLLKKTKRAVNDNGVKSVIVSGGVSRNSLLREMFHQEFNSGSNGTRLYIPAPQYCTDNASMIAWLGYEKYIANPGNSHFDYSVNVYSRAFFKEKGKHR